MGNTEAETPLKPEKASSPVQEQTSVHAYPDWAAMQAYYNSGVNMPPPYYNSAVAPGHAPHGFMWPQPMMPPFGPPFAALYPHGGVYAHPSMALGSHLHGQVTTASGSTNEVVMATPVTVEMPSKSKDQSLAKKLKGSYGLAPSVNNGNAGNNKTGDKGHGLSRSAECATDGSSEKSDGNNGNKNQKKRNFESMSATGKDVKVSAQAKGGDANASTGPSGVSGASSDISGQPLGTTSSADTTTRADLNGCDDMKVKKTAGSLSPRPDAALSRRDGLPPELWIHDERELKRERRKQSNRESARRSRLRKQAESEELAVKVTALSAENATLRAEVNKITELSKKLRAENSALLEKLENVQPGQAGETENAPDVVKSVDLLSKIDDSNPSSRSGQRVSESQETNTGSKLHQLLDPSPRADAVAAG
ncbi:Common plant regulatory factor 1 [Acorus gramineus]|uniref:Common plant regulatory factor 1 n=1 Tax=Acorus gramineus TaxID=55184 RepID=A0AAV9BF51_ACOGR|nr:Common plant regulatory factor 1 [Acorus gramineus]